MDRLTVGAMLGDRYELDELLARREGGGLDYWSANDTTLDRLVAVTVLPATGEHAAVAEAVLDGARRVASVDDPRLVRVLDVGTEDGLAWIVEEGLSDAESLASLVASQPLPAEEVRRIIGESAAALESARRRGLHHLYLNPHAVLRTGEGTVKVSGVGVASALEGTDDVTAAEASVIDTADLVSLLYTGLTGSWAGDDIAGLRPARRLEDGSYPAPSEMVGGVPGDLDALCRQVLGPEDDLSQAPHTPGELARQLSPWSPEMVDEDGPSSFTAPMEAGGDASAAALGGTAGASAAAAAARSRDGGADGDATTVVPKPFYRDGRPGHGDAAAPDGTAGDADGASGDRPATGGSPDPDDGDGDGTDRGGDAGGGVFFGDRSSDDPDGSDGTADGERTGPQARPSTAEMLGIRRTGERVSPRSRTPGGAAGGAPAGTDPRDPAVQGLDEERGTGGQTAAVLLVLVGILGLAAVLGWSVLNGIRDRDTDPAAQPGTSVVTDDGSATDEPAEDDTATGAPAESEAPPAEETAPPAAGSAPAILGITSYDPEGDGDERNDLTPLAVDGDDSTEWTSHTYLSEGWGSLKSGTGLILDLGEGATVSEVDVLLGEGEMGVRAYVSTEASRSGATEIGSTDGASGTWEVRPEAPATGRYLIIWFDSAHTTDAGELVSVREISVR